MPQPTPFVFGKLPAHGDFIMRGLTQASRQVWDDWASDVMQAMRDQAGESFEAWHDAAPPWRFVVGGGVLAADWSIGAVAPSIDSAGRRFMVVLGVQGLTPAGAVSLALPVAETLEQLIYHTLGSGLDADATLAEIAQQLGEILQASAPVIAGLDARPAVEGLWWSGADPQSIVGAAPPRQIFGVGSSSLEGAL